MEMTYKRIAAALAAVLVPVMLSAQAQINTKKMKIEDFTEKTTKVVMTGNIFFDQVFKDEVQSRWRISPFEFCSLEEFETLKTSGDYYFLMVVKGQFRKEAEPGLAMLSVMKGGEEAARGLNRMLDVVTVPIMSAENPSGREFVFLPALIDVIQDHILLSMERDVAAYSGLANYTMNLGRSEGMDIVFAEDDLSDDISEKARQVYFRNGITVTDTDSADEIMTNQTPRTLVSFTVYPSDGKKGSYCYKMLIDASTHEMYYYRRHKISARFGPGFLLEDINRIATR